MLNQSHHRKRGVTVTRPRRTTRALSMLIASEAGYASQLPSLNDVTNPFATEFQANPATRQGVQFRLNSPFDSAAEDVNLQKLEALGVRVMSNGP